MEEICPPLSLVPADIIPITEPERAPVAPHVRKFWYPLVFRCFQLIARNEAQPEQRQYFIDALFGGVACHMCNFIDPGRIWFHPDGYPCGVDRESTEGETTIYYDFTDPSVFDVAARISRIKENDYVGPADERAIISRAIDRTLAKFPIPCDAVRRA